ncbi:hypothetical protein QQX13_09425 [Demequina sp. SYSU T00068]|uniref:hypothetical protein n=1 Tax=Demequina lignilytica TaxID=3051663 RepID=UPI00261FD12D|nr:hypothetical protein [Demequina sp. SYSU T00068]MDN4491049.1 hypothetical protein [Demequina sp. SYSU T00068]
MWTVLAAVLGVLGAAMIPALKGDFALPHTHRLGRLLDLRERKEVPESAAMILDAMIVEEAEELQLRYGVRDARSAAPRLERVDRAYYQFVRWSWLWFPLVGAITAIWPGGLPASGGGTLSGWPTFWVMVLFGAVWAPGARWLATRFAYSTLRVERAKSAGTLPHGPDPRGDRAELDDEAGGVVAAS